MVIRVFSHSAVSDDLFHRHITQAERSPVVSPTNLITQSSHEADSHLPPFAISISQKGHSAICAEMCYSSLATSQTHLLKLQLHSVCACMWESVLPNQNKRSDAFTMSYLEHVFVEQPCPKHSDTICADDGVVPSQQIQGLYLLTVQVEGHRLVLNTVGYPVPSARRKGRVRIDG